MLCFQIWCFAHVHDDDDVVDDNDDVDKAIQFHGTVELVSRANSATPWNQFHDVCEVGSRNKVHSTLKPIPWSRGI